MLSHHKSQRIAVSEMCLKTPGPLLIDDCQAWPRVGVKEEDKRGWKRGMGKNKIRLNNYHTLRSHRQNFFLTTECIYAANLARLIILQKYNFDFFVARGRERYTLEGMTAYLLLLIESS